MADRDDHDTPPEPTRPSTPQITDDPQRAVAALVSGGLVALPTETVYGLAARATDDRAIERVYTVKDRPRDHPLILHLADAADLDQWADQIPDAAHLLATAFWPGPLTLLLLRSARVADSITAGRNTVAIRVPAHQLTRSVIAEAGAVVAPSANRFGRLSPTTAQHVLDDLGEFMDADRDLILDGGPCAVGVESTIVDCTTAPIQILRPGGVTAEQIAVLLGQELAPPSGPSRASGMLAAHYAPRARVVLAESRSEALALAEGCRSEGKDAEIIDVCDDLERYARDMYALFHDADRRGSEIIIAVLPDEHGLGAAIRDRLTKAAADHGPQPPTARTNRDR